MSNSLKRGLPLAETMAYVGVKRRTFDALWSPRLVALHQGTALLFDRQDLDRLFDEFKQERPANLQLQTTCTSWRTTAPGTDGPTLGKSFHTLGS